MDIGELASSLNAQCARRSQSQAQVYNLSTTYSNYSNLSTYNHNGYSDYSYLLDEYDDAYDIANANAGVILTDNLQDSTAQTGLAMAGWRPKVTDMEAQAVDWWSWGKFPKNEV